MRTFDSKSFRKEIIKEYGSVKNLKNYLKTEAKDTGWDCRLSEVVVNGVTVKYTDNPNHFAEFFVSLPHVGFTGTYALDAGSITRAGKRRGNGTWKVIL